VKIFDPQMTPIYADDTEIWNAICADLRHLRIKNLAKPVLAGSRDRIGRRT
jgi:hypothetical protein